MRKSGMIVIASMLSAILLFVGGVHALIYVQKCYDLDQIEKIHQSEKMQTEYTIKNLRQK